MGCGLVHQTQVSAHDPKWRRHGVEGTAVRQRDFVDSAKPRIDAADEPVNLEQALSILAVLEPAQRSWPQMASSSSSRYAYKVEANDNVSDAASLPDSIADMEAFDDMLPQNSFDDGSPFGSASPVSKRGCVIDYRDHPLAPFGSLLESFTSASTATPPEGSSFGHLGSSRGWSGFDFLSEDAVSFTLVSDAGEPDL